MAENLASATIFFLFFLLSARMLPPEEFGVAALVIAIWQMLQPLVEALFHDAIIQRRELQPVDVDTAFTTTLLTSLLLSGLLCLLAPAIEQLTQAPQLSLYLPWVGLSLVGLGLSAVVTACARRELRFRAVALSTITARTIATMAGSAFLLIGMGPAAVVAQSVLGATLGSILILLVLRPTLRFKLERSRLSVLLPLAGPAVLVQFLQFSGGRLFTLIVSGCFGPAWAATWSVALRFVEPVQTMSATAINQIALPHYARCDPQSADFRSRIAMDTRRTAALLVPIFAGLGICAPELIGLAIGPQWLAAAPVLTIICLVLALVSARQVSDVVLTSVGAPHLNLCVQLLALVLSLCGFVAFARGGLATATLGWALRLLAFLLLTGLFVRLRTGVGAKAQARMVAPSLGAATAMVLGVAALRIGAPVESHPYAVLVGSILVGALLYVAALLVLDRQVRGDVRTLLVQASMPSKA